MKTSLQLGTACSDITPPPGTLMAGQLAPIHAQGVESPLRAIALALTDGACPVMIIACDILMMTNELARRLEQDITSATGIKTENIILTATHTHSGPSMTPIFGYNADQTYCDLFCGHVVEAARQAIHNLHQGRLDLSAGECPGYAFNRRFVMSDGTIETHPLKGDPHIVRPEGPDSTRLMTWIARDRQDRPLAAMVNFGCHATVLERNNRMISADYPGKTTAALAGHLGGDTQVLFLQGACGNICQVNPRDKMRHEVGLTWAKTMGQAIASRAMEMACHSVSAVGPLRVLTQSLTLPRRVIDPDLLTWAQQHHKPAKTPPTPDLSDYGVERFGELTGAKVSLAQLFKTPFWADFYAREILTLDRMHREQPLMPLTVKVVAQDNWAMVTVPCELFAEWTQLIVAESPFEFTAVVELANGWNGYIPTREAFCRQGGYETKAVTSTLLVPEAGELLFAQVLTLLKAAK